MKRSIALLIAAVFAVQLSGTVFAEDMPRQRDWSEKRIEHLSKKLSLTEDQKTKLAVILKENDAKRKAGMEQMKALRAAEDQQIKSLLTQEQVQKFDTMRAQQKERMGKMGKKGGKGKSHGKDCQCPGCGTPCDMNKGECPTEK